MADKAQSIAEKLDDLGEMFRTRLQHDTVQQQAFDQLYKELKQYKDDFLFQAEKPFLLDLLLFYDSLQWFGGSLQKGDMDPAVVQESFQYLVDEFLELLYRRDVIPSEPVEKFDRRVHKAVRLVPAATPEDDWKIDSVLKRGFLRGERVLRPEEVSVARYGSHPGDSDPKTETS